MRREEKKAREFFTKFYLASFLTALVLHFCKKGGFLVDGSAA
jgi:hypothetical protein